MKRTAYAFTAALIAVGLLTGCGSDHAEERDPVNTSEKAEIATTEPEEPVEEFDSAAATKELEETLYIANGEREISESCEGDYSRWQCFFESFEVPHEGRIDVNLAFPGGVDEKALAEDARRWVKNMLMDNIPELDTIVAYNSSGLDLGTTRRD